MVCGSPYIQYYVVGDIFTAMEGMDVCLMRIRMSIDTPWFKINKYWHKVIYKLGIII